MRNSEIIDTLRAIRVELLHYWSQESNPDQKEKLSDNLNELDKSIQSLMLKQNSLDRLTRG